MLTTQDWIIACERQGLLTSADVRRLRQLTEVAIEDFSPRVLLKWLATRERISADQADQILSGPPDLTPVDLIVRILGTSADDSESLDVELALRDLDETEDDTKDLAPLDREAVADLVLPPRGSPAFAGTITAPKTAAKPVAAVSKSPEPVAIVEAQPSRQVYSSVFDELLADAGSTNAPLPSLKSRPVPAPQSMLASPAVLAGAVATALVLLIAVVLLWRASR